ncbi:MptD family putative ECF transporter S component [Brachybacterium sp. AOP35-5H-19]|uniref:MptD family putative ECF transporter S component n=1 Tax=Brachybacterium sp. AOP35-5H-19 TaxID=3457685 RepID=UPI004033746C
MKITDLMNVGIFFVIGTVVGLVVSFTGVTPVTFVMTSALQALVLGIPMMLFIAKIRKPGMLAIYAVLSGAAGMLMGMGPYSLIVAVAVAVIGELLLRAGNYRSARNAVLAYAFITLISVGNYIPMFFATSGYLADTDMANKYGASYADGIAQIGQMGWLFVLIVVVTFLCGIVGGLLGRRVFTKHFRRAGIV